jgi:tetratricopeptide (TPR) repeat protein
MKSYETHVSRMACGGAMAVFLLLSGGCFRDPNVRKQEYVKAGDDYLSQARYKEAKIYYSKAIQIDPQMASAHYGLAKSSMQSGDVRVAYQEFLRTTTIDPTNVDAQVSLGEILLAGGATREAKDKALEILSQHPDNTRAQLIVANADAALGDLNAAMEEAGKAVEMTPGQAITHLNLSVMQERSKDLAAAEASLMKAAEVDPKSSMVQIALGSFYQRRQRLADAEAAMNKAIELDPKNPLPRGLLALIFVRDNKAERAEDVLRQAKKDLADNPNGYRMLGEFYVRRGNLDKGVEEFASLHKEHGKETGVTLTYAELLATAKRYDEATMLTNELIKADGSNVQAMTLRSKIEAVQGKPSIALETMKTALKAAPNDPRVHFDLGLAYQNAGNSPQAKVEWQSALKIRPRMAEAVEALAGEAVRENDMKSVQTYAAQLVAIRPDLPQGYLYAGTAAAGLGDLAGAEKNYAMLVQIAPTNAIGYAKLGAVRVAQKRLDDAAKLFDEGLKNDPKSYDALSGAALVLLAKKRIPEAIAKVQSAVESAPTSANTTLLGKLYVENKQANLAESELQKARDLDPKNADATYLLYQLKVARGARDEAYALVTDAVKNGTNDPRLHTVYGMGLEARGDWQAAEAAYQKALVLRPDDAMAANNLAYLLLEHGGDPNLALSLAQTARRGMPKAGATADTLAWASYHVGAYDTARKLLEEASGQQPSNATYHYHLGLTYLKLNQGARGKAELEKALKLNPAGDKSAEIQDLITKN